MKIEPNIIKIKWKKMKEIPKIYPTKIFHTLGTDYIIILIEQEMRIYSLSTRQCVKTVKLTSNMKEICIRNCTIAMSNSSCTLYLYKIQDLNSIENIYKMENVVSENVHQLRIFNNTSQRVFLLTNNNLLLD